MDGWLARRINCAIKAWRFAPVKVSSGVQKGPRIGLQKGPPAATVTVVGVGRRAGAEPQA